MTKAANKGPLPRARPGKDFFEKTLKISLPRARDEALSKGLFLC